MNNHRYILGFAGYERPLLETISRLSGHTMATARGSDFIQKQFAETVSQCLMCVEPGTQRFLQKLKAVPHIQELLEMSDLGNAQLYDDYIQAARELALHLYEIIRQQIGLHENFDYIPVGVHLHCFVIEVEDRRKFQND